MRTFGSLKAVVRAVSAASRQRSFGGPIIFSSQRTRPFSTDTVDVPPLADQSALHTLRHLLAVSWVPLDHSAHKAVDAAVAATSDEASKAALESGKLAAEAVEEFGEVLEHLRMEVDELSGGKFGGEQVAALPSHIKSALETALQRYDAYLAAFGPGEEWLQRKVKEEVGSQLITIKQRCAGLDPEWNKISLLGTSGLSGSFIEQRAK